MKNINNGKTPDAKNGINRRYFLGITVIGLTLVSIEIERVFRPEQQDTVETVYDMTTQYNDLNTNFENFFLLASRDKTARWKQEGDKRMLIYEKYNLSVERSTMFLTIQDPYGDTMNVTYVMESGKFSINRKNVDGDTILTIHRAMGELQKLF